jgi:hypothetical protein
VREIVTKYIVSEPTLIDRQVPEVKWTQETGSKEITVDAVRPISAAAAMARGPHAKIADFLVHNDVSPGDENDVNHTHSTRRHGGNVGGGYSSYNGYGSGDEIDVNHTHSTRRQGGNVGVGHSNDGGGGGYRGGGGGGGGGGGSVGYGSGGGDSGVYDAIEDGVVTVAADVTFLNDRPNPNDFDDYEQHSSMSTSLSSSSAAAAADAAVDAAMWPWSAPPSAIAHERERQRRRRRRDRQSQRTYDPRYSGAGGAPTTSSSSSSSSSSSLSSSRPSTRDYMHAYTSPPVHPNEVYQHWHRRRAAFVGESRLKLSLSFCVFSLHFSIYLSLTDPHAQTRSFTEAHPRSNLDPHGYRLLDDLAHGKSWHSLYSVLSL